MSPVDQPFTILLWLWHTEPALQVDVNFALREMTDDNKAAAELAVDRIRAGGGTNLSGGLFKGIDQHQQAPEGQQQTGMFTGCLQQPRLLHLCCSEVLMAALPVLF